MQWTCQLVVKTGTPPCGRVDGPSPGGVNLFGSRTAWVVSIVPWRRTPWTIAQMWRGTDGGSRRSLPNQSGQLSDYRTLVR